MENQQKKRHFFFTSQNVTRGHPDKLCDYISDSVLDACLEEDPQSKVACQSAVKNSLCMVFGQVATKAQINFQKVVRQAIKQVGYDKKQIGMDYKTAIVIVSVDTQSPQIAQSVHLGKDSLEIGAGDQGLMIGYATDETTDYMPLTHHLCNQLIRRLEEVRQNKILLWVRPDAKVQVTVEYEKNGNEIKPLRVDTILISCQHSEDVSNQVLRQDLKKHVIQHIIPQKWLKGTKLVLNPSGKFTIGGPTGDAGLTGRKIIADTYGGWGGHGGGAFSGKDPSKVDRSAAYAVRWIAKSLVANKFCKRVMVQVAYSIGISKPLSIFVDSYETVAEGYTDDDLINIVQRNFDLRPGAIIRDLKLKRPIYKKTSHGCHYGRNDPDFTWEIVKDLSHQKIENNPNQAHMDQKKSSIKEMELSKQQLRKVQKKLNVQKKIQNKQKQMQAFQSKINEVEKPQKKEKMNKKQLSQQYVKEFQNQKIFFLSNKKLPSANQDNILITSALPYVNNVPHLGNIIGCVLSADVFARFKRLQGNNVLYICGTDEYGTATQIKALQQKKTPKQICDFYHTIHKQVYEWFDIAFDHFGRTSTVWHQKICQQIFLEIKKNGKIKQEQMTQCFCQNCDLFLADRFICGICPFCQYQDARGDQCDKCQKLFNSPTEMKDYKCSICKKTPVIKQTVHFFIDLPQIQQKLQQWIKQSSVKGKWTQNSIATTKAWLNMGLKPKCITRDLKWGVPVPLKQFEKKVFYVWFDAPIGYISITANLLQEEYKSWWQSKQVQLYQFMGKDNVPFHTVMFPASLIASQLPWTLLHHISTTEYLNYQNGKFSKRNGTGVFGDTASTTGIPSQVWRYYLLINRPQIKDSEFSWKQFIDRNNNQLLANLGNLVQRSLKYCWSSYNGKIPIVSLEKLSKTDLEFFNSVKVKYYEYVQALNKVQLKEGLKLSMEISSMGNKYLQDSKFWQKASVQSGRTQIVIAAICNFIRLLSLIFEPYMPSTSAKINFLLGCEADPRNNIFGNIFNKGDFIQQLMKATQNSKSLRQPVPLFTEYTQEQMKYWQLKFSGKQGQKLQME